ncbi:hypothetical protein AA98_0215 [Escherichia coli 2-011-08_S1_C1]|nr:hypothetical protein AA98_0215 [Escherichia coli 2-011-08_S1_C1]
MQAEIRENTRIHSAQTFLPDHPRAVPLSVTVRIVDELMFRS